jgi:hypothetical protein
VAVLGLRDAGFEKQLAGRGAAVSARARQGSDLIFFYVDDRRGLEPLIEVRKALQPKGAVWVLWPKGRKEFREDDVRAFGPEAGLVDVKVVAFSPTLSALKMVIPLAQRPKA